MITLKDFMEAVEYRITEGSEYGWQCYGNQAFTFDSCSGESDDPGASIIFDRATQEVYEVTVYDYKKPAAYRLINPAYRDAYLKECDKHSVPQDQAWDEVSYVDLDVDEDFLEKLTAIVRGEEYDDRIQLPLDLPKEDIHELMLLAHKRDITLNALVVELLNEQISRLERDGK